MAAPEQQTQNLVEKSPIIDLYWNGKAVVLEIGMIGWIIIIGFCLVPAIFLIRRLCKKNNFYTDSVQITFGKNIKQTLKQNHDTVRLAHQAYIELKTRKIGLPFDSEHDVISEVYNSWYVAFSAIRDQIKEIPAEHLRKCGDTEKLSNLLIDVLNLGLRPHLTRWQAKYRRWYEIELEKSDHAELSPQDIQRKYKHYDALVEDLKEVNESFDGFLTGLKDLALKKN